MESKKKKKKKKNPRQIQQIALTSPASLDNQHRTLILLAEGQSLEEATASGKRAPFCLDLDNDVLLSFEQLQPLSKLAALLEASKVFLKDNGLLVAALEVVNARLVFASLYGA